MRKKYDVIIVGTGVAGCFTALNLTEDKEILMITKSELEESDSFLAQGGICVLKNEEDYSSFFEDTMKAGHYENDERSVDVMIRSSREVINQLIRYGADFASENGNLLYTREGAHSTARIVYHDDLTGKEITETLLKQVKQRKNITIAVQTTMLDLVCKENRCMGIVAKLESGEIHHIMAENVVWACGGIGGIYEHSTNYPHLTGDAIGIALKRKIKIRNLNYVQIHPTTLFSEKSGRRFLISESVRGEGATLHNKAGQRFVNELLPRDILTQKIRKQMKADGMPYVWLSMKAIQGCDIQTRFPNICARCLEEGYDVTKQYIPVVPAQHYFMGGVEVDLVSRTSMPNLYAVGETSCNGVHGANRLASNSLLESMVFAKRAALQIIADGLKPLGRQTNGAVQKRGMEQLNARGVSNSFEEYTDTEAYMADFRDQIRKEIAKSDTIVRHNRGEQDESNHNQIKCG